jgi:electron transport complex protein RnfC
MIEQACIRCGECSTPCPAGIHPQRVLAALRRDDITDALASGLEDCMACGRCDEVCPSQIPLSTRFALALAEHQAQQAKQAFALASRERYRAHQARLQREHQEQANERASKRANHAAASAVAAALARKKQGRQQHDEPT